MIQKIIESISLEDFKNSDFDKFNNTFVDFLKGKIFICKIHDLNSNDMVNNKLYFLFFNKWYCIENIEDINNINSYDDLKKLANKKNEVFFVVRLISKVKIYPSVYYLSGYDFIPFKNLKALKKEMQLKTSNIFFITNIIDSHYINFQQRKIIPTEYFQLK